jgi:microcystin-dependent protein
MRMDPFIGEIKMWSFEWAPRNWALCNGQELPIVQNQALYSLLGNQFGEPSSSQMFKLPDLRGRTPIGAGLYQPSPAISYIQGTALGSETVTLHATNLPRHDHGLAAMPVAGTAPFPDATLTFANVVPDTTTTTQAFNAYQPVPADQQSLAVTTVTDSGGGMAHDNMQPFLVMNFCICISGIYPPRQ